MSKLFIASVLAAFVALPAFAATKEGAAPSAAQSRQQSRMAACNQEAVGKKGDERKAFMKQCLSAKTAATPADGAKAARTTPR